MHDSIELEKRKIPSVPVHTDLFIPTAKAIAAASGIPSYPFVVVPHPISRLTDGEIKNTAEMAIPQVIELLLKK